MKALKIINSYFETSTGGVAEELFTAGQVLPAEHEGAQRQRDRGNAELIDVPDDAEKAAQAAEVAQAAADKAADKAASLTDAAAAAAQVAAAQ